MLLLLIRHGETVDNIAGLYAGVSDSKLTNQGVLQASRLADSLATKFGPFTHVFASDLQRAQKTGQAVVDRQNQTPESSASNGPVNGTDSAKLELQVLPVLREQDFGSMELQKWSGKPGTNGGGGSSSGPGEQAWVPPETKTAMDVRANSFIDEHLMPLFDLPSGSKGEEDSDGLTVAVVSHGMLLSRLWKCLLARCEDHKRDLVLASEVEVGPRGIEHLGSWSNTGYLVLRVATVSGGKNELEATPPEAEVIVKGGNEASKGALPPSQSGAKDDQPAFEEPTEDLPTTQSSHIAPVPKRTALKITVEAVNVTEHLRGLKRTRGGVGSAAHDDKQKTIHSFFKKRQKS